MRKIIFFMVVVFAFVSSFAFGQTFNDYVANVKAKALEKNFDKNIVDEAFRKVTFLQPVIKRDTHQLQEIQTFQSYKDSLLSNYRIQQGKKQIKKYEALLNQIQENYSVPKQVIVALWGLESAYGKKAGDIPEFSALLSLAYHSDRRKFFETEIFSALKMLQEHKVPLKLMKGSWAGAMGQCQFIPSTYLEYAVSFNEPGPPNIWTNVPDVLASIANFLKQNGWRGMEQTVIPVKLIKPIKNKDTGLNRKFNLQTWQKMGVVPQNSQDFTKREDQKALYSLLEPDKKSQRYYLVNWDNFIALLRWNDSKFYALSVGLLANEFK